MTFTRSAVARAFSLTRASNSVTRLSRARPINVCRVKRRYYSSGSEHEPKKASSDLPWLIGAVAVTVPGCAYFITPSKNDHGHDGAHEGDESSEGEDGHEEVTHDEAEEHGSDGHQEQLDQDAESPSEEAEGSESREDGSKSSDDSATDEEDHEEKDVSEMGEFEGAKKAEKKPRDQQEMGGNILVGQTDAEDKDETGARKDTPSTAKEPLSQNQMSGDKDAPVSQKGEGTVETGKLQGTVRPDRLQV